MKGHLTQAESKVGEGIDVGKEISLGFGTAQERFSKVWVGKQGRNMRAKKETGGMIKSLDFGGMNPELYCLLLFIWFERIP